MSSCRMFDREPTRSRKPASTMSHLAAGQEARPQQQPKVERDLSGKAKALMAIGAGATGKTTLLRWVCEQALLRDSGAGVILATVDPINRELGQYFPTAVAPKSSEPAQVTAWLERLLTTLMEDNQSAAIDFGGGDTSLGRLVHQIPDLATMLDEAHVAPVALYTLSPRPSDLTPLAAMEAAGFKPEATALILNEGRADPTREIGAEFAQIRRHSVYKAALDRGAVEIWMPRLYAAKAIEDRHISFAHAQDGTMPEGRSAPPARHVRSEPDAPLAARDGRGLRPDIVVAAVTADTSIAPDVGDAIRVARDDAGCRSAQGGDHWRSIGRHVASTSPDVGSTASDDGRCLSDHDPSHREGEAAER